MRFYLMSSYLAGSVLMAQAAMGQTVTVQSGDSLYSIARTQLGDGTAWSELCAANSDLLRGDCNRLTPGMVLTLPGQTEPAPTPDPVMEPAPAQTATLDAVFDFSTLEEEIFTAPDGFNVDQQIPGGPALLSGNADQATPSAAPGISLVIPTELEEAVSGQEVVVEILARLSTPGEMAMAYSTNEVGNSGWQRFELGTNYERLEMRYDVSEMVNGNKDYLGFLPDPMNTGQVLDISFIGISVAE